MSGRTRVQNQARLVRCSAGCGRLVWLDGALPVAGDAEFVCPTCTAAQIVGGGEPPLPCPAGRPAPSGDIHDGIERPF